MITIFKDGNIMSNEMISGVPEADKDYESVWEYHVTETKSFRVELNNKLDELNNAKRKSRSRAIAATKLKEAIMWLGEDLAELKTLSPYPDSFNPNNTNIEPTADKE